VLVQSEYYLAQKSNVYVGDVNKMLAGTPDYVVFNGMYNQYREHPLTANPGELVRLYVVNAGPNSTSAFHLIGAIFSGVFPDGNVNNKLTGVQTYNIPPGGAAMFEATMPDAGAYPFVTHSFADASKGAIGVIQVGPPAVATSAAQSTNAAAQPPVAAGGKLNVIATDNKFDQTQIAAKAGETTTISLVNHGTAVHNLRVVGLKGADGKDVPDQADRRRRDGRRDLHTVEDWDIQVPVRRASGRDDGHADSQLAPRRDIRRTRTHRYRAGKRSHRVPRPEARLCGQHSHAEPFSGWWQRAASASLVLPFWRPSPPARPP